MIDALRNWWAGLDVDSLVAYGFVATLILLAAIFPKAFRRSLLSWFGEPPPPRAVALRSDIEALMADIQRQLRPTFLMVPAESPGFSKLGGDPELPSGASWPDGFDRPRAFLAQIDLAELPDAAAIDWLPPQGRLYAFYDAEAHGEPDVVRIIHSLEPPGASVPAPPRVQARYAQRRIGFHRLSSAPSLDWLGLDVVDLGLDEDALDALHLIATAPPPDDVQHRIGGYPNEIQTECMWLACEHLARNLPEPQWRAEIPPALERAAKAWRLLLQIDSDPGLKMNFGDGGRLYVFIREQDARRADFSQTVSLWQTY